LSEWALQKCVVKHLGEAFDRHQRCAGGKRYAAVSKDCAMLLSMLAYCDATSSVEPSAAFEQGSDHLDIK
jgi:hypothetical protein